MLRRRFSTWKATRGRQLFSAGQNIAMFKLKLTASAAPRIETSGMKTDE